MRVLAIYRHYWPDTTPYAYLLRVILERLSERGARVTAYTGQPTYNDNRVGARPWVEQLGGVEVRRLATLPERRRWPLARVANTAYFLMRAVAHAVLHRRYDLVIANSHPPVAIGVALRLIKLFTGARYVLHAQDIHPEGLRAIGRARGGPLYRAVLAIDTANCHGADQLVTLSEDMADSLARRGVRRRDITVVNNCPLAAPDPEPASPALPECVADPSAARFLFAGNLGRFQRLETLVEAARRVGREGEWRLVFMGAGGARERLQSMAGPLVGRTVFFVGHQSVATAVAAMRACDYGVVSLAPGVCRYAFPSKSMTYLSAGCPLTVVVERDSELARTVKSRRLGYVAQGCGPVALARTISHAIDRRGDWTARERGRLAKECEQLYGKARMLEAWDRLMERLAPGELTERPPAAAGRHAASAA